MRAEGAPPRHLLQSWTLMIPEQLRPCVDATAGQWVESMVSGELGTVGGCAPTCFDSYVRICHPAARRDGTAIPWSEVATLTGRTAHPLMQWHALVGSDDPHDRSESMWKGDDPDRGVMPGSTMNPLCCLLAKHTNRADDCIFGLWREQIWFKLSATRDSGQVSQDSAVHHDEAHWVNRLEVRGNARLQLHGRKYILLEGPLSAAGEGDEQSVSEEFGEISPNLLWPLDRAWFLATDIDLDSTIVAGTHELIQEIVGSSDLEAWPVSLADSLAVDADQVNA